MDPGVAGPGAAASAPAAPAAGCTSGKEFLATDCPLTWHGITLYGTYDVGVGWVSHGLPENGVNYEGEALVNRNGNHSQFVLAPNNLSQTGLGVRGKEEFLPGWSVVFNASTGINPQSGQLANMLATNTINNGLPRGSYSETGDGARAGQTFNDDFGGVSSAHYGTLTLGRQRALGTDAMLQYDPAAGAYSFSYIGYNGAMAGGGNTEDTRWDEAVKYRSPTAQSISAQCTSSPTAPAGATRRLAPSAPPPARRKWPTTRPLDSILAEPPAGSPRTSSCSITTRRSACSIRCSGPRAWDRPISRRRTASTPTPSAAPI